MTRAKRDDQDVSTPEVYPTMRMLSHSALRQLALLGVLGIVVPRAHAVNKEMVELQTQVQNLQDSVARLQQSNDERMGVLKDLVQQSADSVNKMSVAVDALQKNVRTQNEGTGGKVDQVSGQVGALNDSVDEIKARLGRLEKALQDVQSQQQSINATLQNMSPAAAGAPAGQAPSPALPPTPTKQQPASSQPLGYGPGTRNPKGKPAAGTPLSSLANAAPAVATTAPPPTAPAAGDLYKTALSDYMSAKYPLSSSEFSEVIRLYPEDQLAGSSFYYLGEIDYRSGKYANAVRDYDRVLEQFPDNPKVAVARLHKGMALFAQKDNDAGARELRTLIARFPSSPEATQARSKLNGMGIAISPKR